MKNNIIIKIKLFQTKTKNDYKNNLIIINDISPGTAPGRTRLPLQTTVYTGLHVHTTMI